MFNFWGGGWRLVVAGVSAVVVVAGVLAGASLAQADSVQVQSYQRASQAEACVAQVGETPWQASWGADSSWSPTYEMWANNGTGGWTCTRSITWARTPVAASSGGGGGGGSVTYALGDIGPGGGLVFLISGGLTYEMAPNTWGANETTGINWCNDTSLNVTGAVGTAVGTGSANTTAIDTACTSGAGQSAADYSASGLSDWFLPSKDELNAMCNYSRTWVGSPSTGTCTGAQDSTFASGTYGFASVDYWSSSQFGTLFAWYQRLGGGSQLNDSKVSPLRVRPVRSF